MLGNHKIRQLSSKSQNSLVSLVTKVTERDNLVILGELKHSVISDDLDNYVIFENFVTRLEFSSQFSSHFQNSHPFSIFPQFGL